MAWAQDEDWGALVWLVMATGLRRPELLALRWADVDVDTGMLTVRRNFVRSGNRRIEKDTKTRRLAVDPETVAMLADHGHARRRSWPPHEAAGSCG